VSVSSKWESKRGVGGKEKCENWLPKVTIHLFWGKGYHGNKRGSGLLEREVTMYNSFIGTRYCTGARIKKIVSEERGNRKIGQH